MLVRVFSDDRMGMRMQVVRIVMFVGMGVSHAFVYMEVRMSLPEDQPNPRGHQQEGGQHDPAPPIPQDENGGQGADERAQAEERPRS